MISTAHHAAGGPPGLQASLGGPLAAPLHLARLLPLALALGTLVTALRLAAALPSRLAVPQVRPSPAGPALSPVFTPEVREWQAEIQAWSAEHALPAALIATVMQIESCGDARALSSAGAQGLFQVMPFHFQPGESAGDPHTNARRGLTYLSQALRLSQGRIDLALAGYNGGLSRIQQAPEAWPAETRRYVAWGAGIYADAQAGRTSSPTLEAWLAAGGASLCRAAAQPS